LNPSESAFFSRPAGGQCKTALLCGAPSPRGSRFADASFCSPADSRGGSWRALEELVLVQIFVRDNNVDQALKALKKKMQREGSFREMKRHVHYEKPSEKRARQKAEAVRRARKLARKRAQREGLLPAPKKVVR
jgi:small subunit ribosomal protein S21